MLRNVSTHDDVTACGTSIIGPAQSLSPIKSGLPSAGRICTGRTRLGSGEFLTERRSGAEGGLFYCTKSFLLYPPLYS